MVVPRCCYMPIFEIFVGELAGTRVENARGFILSDFPDAEGFFHLLTTTSQ